jgi:hypothetical protein
MLMFGEPRAIIRVNSLNLLRGLWSCSKKMIVKVPKHENFKLAFLTLSDSIWVGDLGTEAKCRFFFFFILVLISMDFGLLPHAECSVKTIFS